MVVIVLACALAISPKLYALGSDFFDNTGSSGNCDTSACGSSFVSLVTGETRFVQKTGVYAIAYFTTSSGQITIYNGNYCPAQASNPDFMQSGDYYDTNGWPANGTAITNYVINGKTYTGYKYPGTDTSHCNLAMTVPLSNLTYNSTLKLYEAPIDVSYIDGVSNKFDGVENYFSLAETGGGTYAIAQKGGSSGYEVTAEETSGPANMDYYVHFGADCSVTSDRTAYLYYYDIDNDGGSGAQQNGKISMELIDNTAGKSLLSWTPPTNNNAASSQAFTVKAGHRYTWIFKNVYSNNTIQYSTPYDGIYYLKPCGWSLEGSSTVSSATAAPGQTVTFTHKVTNDGPLAMDKTFSTTVEWTAGNSGVVLPAATSSALAKGSSITRTPPGFTIPPGAVNGAVYCQRVTFTPKSSSDTGTGYSAQACVTVTIGPPLATKFVNVTPVAGNGPDIEPGDSTSLSVGVSVSGFPVTTDWSYSETAIQAAPVAVAPTRSSYASSNSYYDTPTAVKGVCGRYSSGVCVAWYWYCPSYGTMPGGPTAAAPTCPARYKHTCVSTYYINTSTSGTCNDKWTCPSPNGGLVQYQSSAPTNCNVYRCQYSGAPNYSTTSPSPSQCDYRCSRGTGSPAPLASGSKYASGDENCYLQPTFSVTCSWSSAISSGSQTFSVSADGSYCSQAVPVQGLIIGTTVCVTISTGGGFWTANTPTYIGSYHKYVWGFNYGSTSGCSKVVGKPYVKFYGSDVVTGGGVGVTSTTCSINTAAQIRAQNNIAGGYSGAGVQYAARAMATINGFASAQQTANASYKPGTAPRQLTFANTAGTGTYGGSFTGGAPACVGFIDRLKENNPGISPIKADQIIGGRVMAPGGKTTIYVAKNAATDTPANQQHDVYINGNITYGAWATLGQIPQFQLVVEGGDIYVGSNVTQLDGLYVALQKDGVGGHVYTCANGMRVVPADSFTTCKQQLVVNGSFVAKQVLFLRGCGSLRESVVNEPTVYAGGSDVTTCGPINHAAEVFNYSPEQWIRGVLGPIPNTYDAVSSLPPIL